MESCMIMIDCHHILNPIFARFNQIHLASLRMSPFRIIVWVGCLLWLHAVGTIRNFYFRYTRSHFIQSLSKRFSAWRRGHHDSWTSHVTSTVQCRVLKMSLGTSNESEERGPIRETEDVNGEISDREKTYWGEMMWGDRCLLFGVPVLMTL